VTDAPSGEHSGSPWSQRGFVLAAAFVGGLMLIGLVLLVKPGGDGDSNGGGAKQNATAPTPVRKDPNASVCGLPAGSQQVPAVAPETQWELVGTIAAPTEPKSIGPGIKEGKRRLCFAHSPAGALFAAVNFIAVAGRSPNDTALMRELTAEGAARDELLRQGSEPSDPSFRIQVAGFRMDAYAATETTVDLAFRTSERGALIHMTLPLRWQAGDWKAVIVTAETPFVVERLQNLSGYVPWSGA
jgi:hypothetical protein